MMPAGQLNRQLFAAAVYPECPGVFGGRSAGECSPEKGAQESAPWRKKSRRVLPSQQAKTEGPFHTGGRAKAFT